MVVIAGEVGGRWSGETQTFVLCLAQHKAKSAPKILQASAQVAYYRRWSSLMSCSAAKAFATSLLNVEVTQEQEDVSLLCTRCLVTLGTRSVSGTNFV